MARYEVRRHMRCAVTGCRIHYREVIEDERLLRQDIVMEGGPVEGPPRPESWDPGYDSRGPLRHAR